MAILEVANISAVVAGEKLLSNVNLHINTPGIYGLVGSKNCGKSLLLKILAGEYPFEEGEIHIKNFLMNKDFPVVRTSVEPLLLNMTAIRNMHILTHGEEHVSDEDLKWYLAQVGLEKYEHLYVKDLTVAQQEMLALAIKLVENPSVILLDEPFVHLSAAEIAALNKLLNDLKKQNKVIVIAAQNADFIAAFCDELFIISEGKLTKKPPF